MAKLWGGRFTKNTDAMVDEFQASISFDHRMYYEDIKGSIAHATMLAKTGIISDEERDLIIGGLESILADIEAGNFSFEVGLEDIHMNIEARLTERIGAVGGTLHTARSRNDQVAVDTHLYLRKEIGELAVLLQNLQEAFLNKAQENKEVIMPGYTHLQRAQPILFAQHMMAYFFMLARDFDRLQGVYERTDIMPLGAGALAGTTFPIDRFMVAEQLKFGKLYANSMDAVSDRDYIIEFLSFASLLIMHLSRISEEIILWCSAEFGFIELDDAHCTGSSIMPQKKNPDVAELVRGKTGRIFGHLMGMLTTTKGLPLAYNKDLQEDKEGVFDTIDNLKFVLTIYAAMIRDMRVNRDRMYNAVTHDFSNATDMADYLGKKGLPFRQAHEVVGKSVRYCIDNNKWLMDLTLDEFKQFSPLFEEDIMDAISVETCVTNRNSYGGTSYAQVAQQFETAQKTLENQQVVIDKYTQKGL